MKALTVLISMPLVLILGGCAPAEGTTVSSPSSPPVSAPPSPSPSIQDLSLGPVAPDTTIVIKANATAANGSKMKLEMRVRQSVSADDIGSHTVPEALVSACGQFISRVKFASDKWSFTRVNISAISDSGDWPADARITVRPLATIAPIASMSFLSEASGTSGSEQCQLDKYVAGAGKGAVSIGLPHDAQAGGKQFTGWASHSFGFSAAAGVTLSRCSIQVTQNGDRLGGTGISQTSATGDCVNAVTSEKSVF
ncbi:MAG: hypothetical protein H7279_09670 [Microbacteriaceae bacterium]|nr:hypothetical protein [Microbacteriaceae bacterium]